MQHEKGYCQECTGPKAKHQTEIKRPINLLMQYPLLMNQFELIYQNQFLSRKVSQEYNFLRVTWLKQPLSEEFRQEVNALCDTILANNFKKVLCDVRKRDYLVVSDQNWLADYIFPTLSTKLDRLAYLISPVGLQVMDTFRIQDLLSENQNLERPFEVEVFLDKEAAVRWLLGI